ncbi:MAG: response regulator [Anaerolineae bacterium]|nr:response regulator [Anaerolineae bacterium]
MSDETTTDIGPLATEGLPDDFVAQVRNALMHLYDHAHLQRHPLARLAALSPDPFNDSARALRNLLLDTLEQLKPAPTVSPNDKEWRPYGVLLRRYVNGFSIAEVIEELHVSVRQYHREHQKGLLAMAEILWRRWQSELSSPVAPYSQGAVDSLQREVQQLGVFPARLDLATVVEAVLGPAQALAREMQAGLEVRPPRQPRRAWADPTLARQALLAALSASFLSRPRRIELSWGEGERAAAFVIAFEPPLLEDDSVEARERRERLVAAEELMQAQGGQLDTVLEEGRLVEVRLAFREEQTRRILLIDDNERLLRLFERYLTGEGFGVTGALDASQALRALEGDPPDAIVLDVMMRDTDGWQLLQRLRRDAALADVPIVVCSILNEPELAHILGAQAYLRKPVSQRQLLGALHEVLGGSSRAAQPPTER